MAKKICNLYDGSFLSDVEIQDLVEYYMQRGMNEQEAMNKTIAVNQCPTLNNAIGFLDHKSQWLMVLGKGDTIWSGDDTETVNNSHKIYI